MTTADNSTNWPIPRPGSARLAGCALPACVAILFMAFCIVTFLWGLLLFPRYGLANLDAIRPNDNWSDETLLTVIAAAGLSVARLGYAQLAVAVLAALSMVAVGLVIFWRKADSWFGLYVGVLFVWFGTQANFVTDPVGQVLPFLAPIDNVLGNLVWLAFFPLLSLFPDGHFVPRWTRWLLPVWLGLMALFSLQLLPDSLAFAPVALYLVFGVGSQGYRFARRSNAIQRQQTKWVLFSFGFLVVTAIWSISILAASQSGAAVHCARSVGFDGSIIPLYCQPCHAAYQHRHCHPALSSLGHRRYHPQDAGLHGLDRAAGAGLLRQRDPAATAVWRADRHRAISRWPL